MFVYLVVSKISYCCNNNVTFHTHAKVVGIMRQNACLLAFCVQNLL